jgi:hypothetical protein
MRLLYQLLGPRRFWTWWLSVPCRPRGLCNRWVERGCFRLWAASTAALQAVDHGHLTDRKLEVQDVDVLGNTGGLSELRDHRTSLLQATKQHHLGTGLAVSGDYSADDQVIEGAGVIVVSIEGYVTDR